VCVKIAATPNALLVRVGDALAVVYHEHRALWVGMRQARGRIHEGRGACRCTGETGRRAEGGGVRGWRVQGRGTWRVLRALGICPRAQPSHPHSLVHPPWAGLLRPSTCVISCAAVCRSWVMVSGEFFVSGSTSRMEGTQLNHPTVHRPCWSVWARMGERQQAAGQGGLRVGTCGGARGTHPQPHLAARRIGGDGLTGCRARRHNDRQVGAGKAAGQRGPKVIRQGGGNEEVVLTTQGGGDRVSVCAGVGGRGAGTKTG
jgi:hypothetical protein